MKKALFCIDITNDKKSIIEEGKEFIVKEVDSFTEQQIDAVTYEVIEVEERVSIGWPLTIVLLVSKLGTLIIGGSLLASLIRTPLSKMYDNAAVMFYILPVLLVTWLSIHFYQKQSIKKVKEDDSTSNLTSRLDSIIVNAKEQLDIPETSIEMDFVSFRYKLKKENIRIVEKGMTKYFVTNKSAFIENGNLCLADLNVVYSIPLSEISAVIKINKSLMTVNWNKDEEPGKGEYKKFKLGVNQFGMVVSKPYYIAQINHEQVDYSLYIPKYEIDIFLELTNLKVTEL